MEIREALEKAAAGETPPIGPPPEPEKAEAVPEVETEAEQPQEAASESRPRDESGKFIAKGGREPERATKAPGAPEAISAPKASTGAPAAEVASAAQPVAESLPVKAPQSWKPAVRELAAKLPAEYRPLLEEAMRVDGEVRKVMQESAQSRQFAQRVQESLAPFEPIARARGMDAFSLAGAALQSVQVLQLGTAQQKAAELAGIIRAYGVDVQELANALDGQAGPVQPMQQPAVNIQAEVQRVFQDQLRQAQDVEAERAMKDFIATQPEFLNDVLPQMAALFTYADQQRRNVTPQEIYDEALWMNPDVRAILQRRGTAEAAGNAQASIQKAKAAAISPKSQPASPPSGAKAKGIRGAMEAAAEKLGMSMEE